METYSPERCAAIKRQLERACDAATFSVESLNYECSVGIVAQKPNGEKMAWMAGVVNRDPDSDDWTPLVLPVEPVILAALQFATQVD